MKEETVREKALSLGGLGWRRRVAGATESRGVWTVRGSFQVEVEGQVDLEGIVQGGAAAWGKDRAKLWALGLWDGLPQNKL